MSIALDDRDTVVETVRSGPSRLVGAIAGGLDLISDLAVLAFASWTVLYHLGLIFSLRTSPLLVVWVITVPVAAVWLVRSRRPARRRPAVAPDPERGHPGAGIAGSRRTFELLVAAVALAVVAVYLIMFGSAGLWWPGWTLAGVSALLTLVVITRLEPGTGWLGGELVARSGPDAPTSAGATLLALATATGLAIFSVFTLKTDADDFFYVNRVAWVAQHGNIPTRDTMFTSQGLPAIRGAGVPVSSIETFQGAVAHVLHLAGGTAAYLMTPPVGTFLAVWALWRLLRAWSPRRRALCFALAMVYLVWGATTPATMGAFFLTRMQQGKVVFVAMLAPLLYLHLTRWVRSPDRRGAIMLAAIGVAAVGLTSSATFLVPISCAAVALPLVVSGRYRHAVGAMIPFAYPLIVGLVVHFSYASVNPNGATLDGVDSLHYVVGHSWFGALGLTAVLVGAWIARSGAPKVVVAGIPVVLLVVVAPGVLGILNDFTGAHAVLWRAIWVAPLPALVGLVAAVPLPRRAAWLAPVPALALAVVVLVAGTLSWSSERGVMVTSKPTWRYYPDSLALAQQIIRLHPGSGPVLAPGETMRALDLTTTRIHPVSPLQSYVLLLDEPAKRTAARLMLSNLMGRTPVFPTAATTKAALATLHVSMVCVDPKWVNREKLFRKAGYSRVRDLTDQVCLLPARRRT